MQLLSLELSSYNMIPMLTFSLFRDFNWRSLVFSMLVALFALIATMSILHSSNYFDNLVFVRFLRSYFNLYWRFVNDVTLLVTSWVAISVFKHTLSCLIFVIFWDTSVRKQSYYERISSLFL